MCGRYQFTAEQCEEIRQIAEAIQRKYGSQNWAPGEIRPANHAPVLTETGGEITPRLMKWGIPSCPEPWSSTPERRQPLKNPCFGTACECGAA